MDRTENSAEDDVDDADRRPSSRSNTTPKRGRGRLPFIAIAVVVVAAVAVTAVLLSSGSSKHKASPKVDPSFATFADQKAGFSLSYPSVWTVLQSIDPNVALLLGFGAQGLDTLLVRVVPTEASVDTSSVASIKAFTDAVLTENKVTVLKQQPITVNGLPGYYYFYSLAVPPLPGVKLVHSHIFVFPPHEMVSLTFQTVEQDFTPLAPTFDQVLASFRTTP